jgi:hypothetical protein
MHPPTDENLTWAYCGTSFVGAIDSILVIKRYRHAGDGSSSFAG